MTDLPFQAEYAKSGRAGCKGCKQKIDQGTLRIAVMVQVSHNKTLQHIMYIWKTTAEITCKIIYRTYNMSEDYTDLV